MLATVLVILYLVGTVGSAIQAMKWLERQLPTAQGREQISGTDRPDS